MGLPQTFEGYAIDSEKNWSDLRKISYKPKGFEDFDIDIDTARNSIKTGSEPCEHASLVSTSVGTSLAAACYACK